MPSSSPLLQSTSGTAPGTAPGAAPGAAPLSVSSLPSPDLTLPGILSELSLCHHRTAQINHQLDTLTEQHNALTDLITPTLTTLSLSFPNITTASQSLSHILSSSALSAQALSSQVRTLDRTQSRLLAALDRVTALLDLHTTITSVKQYKAQGNYEACVKELHRVLYLTRLIENDPNVNILRSLETEIRDELITDMNHKQQQSQHEKQVMNIARLLPYVDRTYLGLSMYCTAIRSILTHTLKSKALTLATQPANSIIPYTVLLTNILDHLAAILKQYVIHIQQYFGPGTQIRLIQELLNECDQQLTPLLKQYIIDKQIIILTNQCKQKHHKRHLSSQQITTTQPHVTNTTPQKGGNIIVNDEIDVRMLDSLLSEIAYIARECDLLDSHMRTLATQATQTLDKAIIQEKHQMEQLTSSTQSTSVTTTITPKSSSANIPRSQSQPSSDSGTTSTTTSQSSAASGPKVTLYYNLAALSSALASSSYTATLPASSSLIEATQDLLSHYITLEEHYMLMNVDKAIKIDTHDGEIDLSNTNDDEDEDEREEGDRRKKADRDSIGSVRAMSDKLTQNISGNISQITAAASSSSSTFIGGIGLIPAIGSVSPQQPSHIISPAFIRRFRLSLTSTVVDDVFYILKKSADRAFSTTSILASCAIVNHVNNILQHDYYDIFTKIMQEYKKKYPLPTSSSTTTSGTGGLTESRSGVIASYLNTAATHTITTSISTGSLSAALNTDKYVTKLVDDVKMIVTFNNIDVSLTHIKTLHTHLETLFIHTANTIHYNQTNNNHHPSASPHTTASNSSNMNMVRHCIDDLLHTSTIFQSLYNDLLKQMVNYLLLRIHPYFNLFLTMDYTFTESDYMDKNDINTTNDLFLYQLCHLIMKKEILPLCLYCCTEHNYHSLIQSLLTSMVKIWEDTIWRKKFSFWGAMQLDREIRMFSNFFTELNILTLNVRDICMRLVQICNILQIEKLAEVREIWGNITATSGVATGTTESERQDMWRLTESEVRKVLALRVEFHPRDINALKL